MWRVSHTWRVALHCSSNQAPAPQCLQPGVSWHDAGLFPTKLKILWETKRCVLFSVNTHSPPKRRSTYYSALNQCVPLEASLSRLLSHLRPGPPDVDRSCVNKFGGPRGGAVAQLLLRKYETSRWLASKSDLSLHHIVLVVGGASPLTQPAVREAGVQSLGQEDPLEKEVATHSSVLSWKIPWTEEPGRLQSVGLQSRKWLSTHTQKHVCVYKYIVIFYLNYICICFVFVH